MRQYIVGLSVLAVGGFVGVKLYNQFRKSKLKHPFRSSPLDYEITKETVSSPFGVRGGSFHNGIDIRTREKNGVADPSGMPAVGLLLRAPFTGKVLKIFGDESTSGGLSMLVRSEDGWIVGFAHLLATAVNEGDSVDAGGIIGAAGKSGTSSDGKKYPPHLHLTLRTPDGAIVDPAPYFGV